MARINRGKALAEAEKALAKGLAARDADCNISRYAVAGWKEAGMPVSGAYHEGPCHSSLNRYASVQALITAPNVEAWKSHEEWTAGRHADTPKWEHSSFFEEASEWWEWLMHGSPWRHVYKTQPSPEEAGEKGVVIDCSAPSNLAMFAIIATRHPHEYPERVRAWSRGVRAGGDPLVMSYLMESIRARTSGEGIIADFARHGGDIHDMFSHFSLSKLGIKQFVTWTLDGKRLNVPLTDSGRFNGIHGLFCKDQNDKGRNPLQERFGKIRAPNSRVIRHYCWGKGMNETVSRVVTFDDGVRALAEISQEIRHEYS